MSEHLEKAKAALLAARDEDDPTSRIRLLDIANVQAHVAMADAMERLVSFMVADSRARFMDAAG